MARIPNSNVLLGTLSNNSQIYLQQNNLSVSPAETNIFNLSMTNANLSDSVMITYTTSQLSASKVNVSGISLTPSSCTLTSSATSCVVTISVESNISPGTYTITPQVSINGGVAETLSPITIQVSNQTSPSSKNLLSFSFGEVNGVITGNNISVAMPYGTSVTNLVATFTIDGEATTVNGVVQQSEVTIHDFSSPVIYTVHASDGSTQDYRVKVGVASTFTCNENSL